MRGRLLLAVVPLVVAGCGGNQNVLHGESHQERSIDTLWWVMFGVSCVGFSFVGFLLLLGWWRRNRRELPGGADERVATWLVVLLGIATPIVLLSALFVWSDIFVMRSTAAPPPGSTAITIEVIGHDWWWEARYLGTPVVTANEIHIPTGTRIEVVGTTADVIHSFWVPELARKIDLIPGRENRLLLEADRPGRGSRRGRRRGCSAASAPRASAVRRNASGRARRCRGQKCRGSCDSSRRTR